MILRIIIISLLFASCTPETKTNQETTNTETAGAEKQGVEVNAQTGSSKNKVMELKSSEQVSTLMLEHFSELFTVTQEQKQAIIDLVSQYEPDQLENPGEQRVELRKRVMSEILTKDQNAIYRESQRKRNLQPVKIE